MAHGCRKLRFKRETQALELGERAQIACVDFWVGPEYKEVGGVRNIARESYF